MNTNQDKIKKICDALRSEAIEPAKLEAERIISEAKSIAEKIIHSAKQKSDQILAMAKEKVEHGQEVFQASLIQAFNQGIETIKQAIEHKLFNDTLSEQLGAEMIKPQVIADLINALINAIEQEGLSQDIAITIPQCVSVDEVNHFLCATVLEKLKKGSLKTGHIIGGAQVKLVGHKITLEITDQAIEEILRSYLRKDFRKLLFRH